MCFYYAIAKKNPERLIKSGVIKAKQLSLLDDHFLVNGFEHPLMPVISDEKPDEVSYFRWGLIPQSVRSDAQAASFLKSYNTLNAHGERIFSSKLYGDIITKQRCLILCSGFFEWRSVKGKKIPYYISLKDDSLFVFAGVWDKWTDETNRTHYTFSVVTTDANDLLAQIHNTKKRMPLILEPEKAKRWLIPTLKEDEIEELIAPLDSKQLKAHTVKQFLPLGRQNISSDIVAYYHYPEISAIVEENEKFKDKPEGQTRLEF